MCAVAALLVLFGAVGCLLYMYRDVGLRQLRRHAPEAHCKDHHPRLTEDVPEDGWESVKV